MTATDEELEAIKDALEKVAPGLWCVEPAMAGRERSGLARGEGIRIVSPDGYVASILSYADLPFEQKRAIAALIVLLHNSAAKLIERVKRADWVIDALLTLDGDSPCIVAEREAVTNLAREYRAWLRSSPDNGGQDG